jgi:hypothetical protein
VKIFVYNYGTPYNVIFSITLLCYFSSFDYKCSPQNLFTNLWREQNKIIKILGKEIILLVHLVHRIDVKMEAVREHFVAYGLRILLCEREVAVAPAASHPEGYNGLETGQFIFLPSRLWV